VANSSPSPVPGQPNNSDDPSTKMWALCISHAERHDKEMLDRWTADMDGILIYVRFSIFPCVFVTLLTLGKHSLL